MADGEHALALAFACQPSEALHQIALDRGSWDSALLLLPMPDALGDPSFGGEEHELAAVHSHRKALKDLKAKQLNHDDSDSGDTDEKDGDAKKKKKKNKFKKKKKETDVANVGEVRE